MRRLQMNGLCWRNNNFMSVPRGYMCVVDKSTTNWGRSLQNPDANGKGGVRLFNQLPQSTAGSRT